MSQASTPAHSGASLTLQRIQPYEHRGIAVVSDAIGPDGRIDDRYSAYFDDLVPDLSWSAIIEAQSYALVVEDPDAPMDQPFIHWLLWNIPGTATAIPAGLSRTARPSELPGAIQGHNSGGKVGWHGTQPPEGHGLHHYHFQLFALSATLDHLPPQTGLAELVDVLKGLTIASGEVVGTYERVAPIDVASPSDAAETSQGRTGRGRCRQACAPRPERRGAAALAQHHEQVGIARRLTGRGDQGVGLAAVVGLVVEHMHQQQAGWHGQVALHRAAEPAGVSADIGVIDASGPVADARVRVDPLGRQGVEILDQGR
jgi:Raf kinase inhibitor-like YbhB/YbcL family protein